MNDTPKRTAEQIKADNAKFRKLSKPRKRVAIARDALAQLGSRLKMQPGSWVKFRERVDKKGYTSDTQLQAVLNETGTCDVCAKGALFVCLVDKANELSLQDIVLGTHYGDDVSTIHGKHTDAYLTRLFSASQLELIELAFEGDSFAFMTAIFPENDKQDINHAKAFFKLFGGDKYTDSEARLKAILENIVANKGTFKPEIQPIKSQWVTPNYRG